MNKIVQVGPFQMNFSREVMFIPALLKKNVEAFLNGITTSASLVRVDMSPEMVQKQIPIFEVEGAPAGVDVWGMLLEDREMGLPEELLNAADTALCFWPELEENYKLLSKYTGWRICHSADEILKGDRIYFAATVEEASNLLENARVDLVTDPCLSKDEVSQLTGGVSLADVRKGENIFESALAKFPNGFVLKPSADWGSRDVYIYSPIREFKKDGHTRSQVERRLESIIQQGDLGAHIVQPFFPPKRSDDGSYVIYRLYAIRNNDSWVLLGGLWNKRKSLKIHGARDTQIGLCMFESMLGDELALAS